VLVGVLGGCGRIGFDPTTVPHGDGGTADNASRDNAMGGAVVVQSTASTAAATTTLAVPIAPTRAGSLVVIAVANADAVQSVVATVADDATNPYQTANAHGTASYCYGSADLWYAPGVAAGATTVTVTETAAVDFSVWVVELGGVSSRVGGATANDQPSTTLAMGPAVATSAGDVAVSIAQACLNPITLHTGGMFTGLTASSYNSDTAYLIATSAGTVGPQWDIATAAMWCGATAAFR
jgi:hypothetical protein